MAHCDPNIGSSGTISASDYPPWTKADSLLGRGTHHASGTTHRYNTEQSDEIIRRLSYSSAGSEKNTRASSMMDENDLMSAYSLDVRIIQKKDQLEELSAIGSAISAPVVEEVRTGQQFLIKLHLSRNGVGHASRLPPLRVSRRVAVNTTGESRTEPEPLTLEIAVHLAKSGQYGPSSPILLLLDPFSPSALDPATYAHVDTTTGSITMLAKVVCSSTDHGERGNKDRYIFEFKLKRPSNGLTAHSNCNGSSSMDTPEDDGEIIASCFTPPIMASGHHKAKRTYPHPRPSMVTKGGPTSKTKIIKRHKSEPNIMTPFQGHADGSMDVVVETANLIVCKAPESPLPGAMSITIYDSIGNSFADLGQFTYTDDTETELLILQLQLRLAHRALEYLHTQATGRKGNAVDILKDIPGLSTSPRSGSLLMDASEAGGTHAEAEQIHHVLSLNQAEQGVLDMLDQLPYGMDISLQLDDGSNLLHLSLLLGFDTLTQKLIEEGCDMEAQDAWSMTPLMYAVLKGNERMTRSLVLAGASSAGARTPRDFYGALPWVIEPTSSMIDILSISCSRYSATARSSLLNSVEEESEQDGTDDEGRSSSSADSDDSQDSDSSQTTITRRSTAMPDSEDTVVRVESGSTHTFESGSEMFTQLADALQGIHTYHGMPPLDQQDLPPFHIVENDGSITINNKVIKTGAGLGAEIYAHGNPESGYHSGVVSEVQKRLNRLHMATLPSEGVQMTVLLKKLSPSHPVPSSSTARSTPLELFRTGDSFNIEIRLALENEEQAVLPMPKEYLGLRFPHEMVKRVSGRPAVILSEMTYSLRMTMELGKTESRKSEVSVKEEEEEVEEGEEETEDENCVGDHTDDSALLLSGACQACSKYLHEHRKLSPSRRSVQDPWMYPILQFSVPGRPSVSTSPQQRQPQQPLLSSGNTGGHPSSSNIDQSGVVELREGVCEVKAKVNCSSLHQLIQRERTKRAAAAKQQEQKDERPETDQESGPTCSSLSTLSPTSSISASLSESFASTESEGSEPSPACSPLPSSPSTRAKKRVATELQDPGFVFKFELIHPTLNTVPMSMAKKMQVRSRSRDHHDDDADYGSSYTSRTTDKKRRSSSRTRSTHKTRKAVSRNLTRQDLQELVHLDPKQPYEPPLAAVHPEQSSHNAPASHSKTFFKTALPSLSSIPSCSPLTWASSQSASSSTPDPSSRRPVKVDPRLPVSTLRARKPSFLSPPIIKTEKKSDSLSVSSPPQTRYQKHKQDSLSALSSHLTREPKLRRNSTPSSRVSKRNAIVKPKSILKTGALSSSISATPVSASPRISISMPTPGISPTGARASFGSTLLPAWPTSALAAASPVPSHASDADTDADVDIVMDAGIRPCSSTVYTVHAKHGLQQPASLSAPVSPVSPPDASDHPRAVSAAKIQSSFQSVASLPEPKSVSETQLFRKGRSASIGPSSTPFSVPKVTGPLPPVRSEPASSIHVLYMPGWGSTPATTTPVSRDPRLRSKRPDSCPTSAPASPATATATTTIIAAASAAAAVATIPEQFATQNSDDHMQHVKTVLKSAINIDGQVALHLVLVRPRDLLSCVLDIDTTIAEMEQYLSSGLKIARDVWYLESQPDSHAATQGALWLMLQTTLDTPQSPLSASCTSDAIVRSEHRFAAADEMPSTAGMYPLSKDNRHTLPLRWSIALAVPQAPHEGSDGRRKIHGLLTFVKATQFSAGKQQDILIPLTEQRLKARSSILPVLSFTATSDTPRVSSQEIGSCASPWVESDRPRQRSRFSSLDDHGYFSDLSDADPHRRTPPTLHYLDTMAPPPSTTTNTSSLPRQKPVYLKRLSNAETPFCLSPVSSSRCFIDLTASDDEDNDNGHSSNNINHEQWVPKSLGRFFDSSAAAFSDSSSVLKQETPLDKPGQSLQIR
ncbi:hypothetical protein BGZ70_001411 [Mortierella alpina]|uniref:Ankyrin repeat protein n=1 Tax=Mortierella alpina TaxID=64518 RepID=A0A9P6M5V0_MORAP|nr:hypothetical protein BGZ70_001411 [Mortierella alpina]